MTENKKIAVIIGAGPAGLTAAYELIKRTDIKPVIFEAGDCVGGLSKTVNYKGNRMDIGGHRFFSKSDRVMKWWRNILPIQSIGVGQSAEITYHGKIKALSNDDIGVDPDKTDKVMLIRPRLSRILFSGKFFDYPLSPSLKTLLNFGPVRIIRAGVSYVLAQIRPVKPEVSLEDFFINKFGRYLYEIFFKDYTEKVWGLPCSKMKADWGRQRVKGLSLGRAIVSSFKKSKTSSDINQKDKETSLIERFLYPKFGPGQMWEEVANLIKADGGQIIFDSQVIKLKVLDNRIAGVWIKNIKSGATEYHAGDYFFSTMPVKDLILGMDGYVPEEVKDVAANLKYRDFMAVGLLVNSLSGKVMGGKDKKLPDNWIYIQEPGVRVGRIQVFSNWSPYLVSNPDSIWLGLEYFCNEGDDMWVRTDEEIVKFASRELREINIMSDSDSVIDGTVVRVNKAYPAYYGSYDKFSKIIDFINGIENLFLIGRNGMHKYNNQDHSMLTAMTAVDNIVKGSGEKGNIWSINTEEDYHEVSSTKQSE